MVSIGGGAVGGAGRGGGRRLVGRRVQADTSLVHAALIAPSKEIVTVQRGRPDHVAELSGQVCARGPGARAVTRRGALAPKRSSSME